MPSIEHRKDYSLQPQAINNEPPKKCFDFQDRE